MTHNIKGTVLSFDIESGSFGSFTQLDLSVLSVKIIERLQNWGGGGQKGDNSPRWLWVNVLHRRWSRNLWQKVDLITFQVNEGLKVPRPWGGMATLEGKKLIHYRKQICNFLHCEVVVWGIYLGLILISSLPCLYNF